MTAMSDLEFARRRFAHAWIARYMLNLADRDEWVRYNAQFRAALRFHLRGHRS